MMIKNTFGALCFTLAALTSGITSASDFSSSRGQAVMTFSGDSNSYSLSHKVKKEVVYVVMVPRSGPSSRVSNGSMQDQGSRAIKGAERYASLMVCTSRNARYLKDVPLKYSETKNSMKVAVECLKELRND